MIKSIAERPPREKLEIDLTGPEGNAHYLLAVAKRLAKQMSIDHEPIVRKMIAGDYEHLVRTFDDYFGDRVILYREEKAMEAGG